ncbi:signal peptidase I [Candidatus Saccharibacteria bacterium]|nr:signal peptidase I [Candidatus Saccharibacteria bacterium]
MDDSYYMQTTNLEISSGVMAGVGIFCLLVLLLVVVPGIIVMWKLFQRAGKPGWAAIVPFYNTYVMTEIAKLSVGWFLAALFVPFVSQYVIYEMAKRYNRGLWFWVSVILFPLPALLKFDRTQYNG